MKGYFVILRYLDDVGYYYMDKVYETDPREAVQYCLEMCKRENGWETIELHEDVEVVAVLSGDNIQLELAEGDFE